MFEVKKVQRWDLDQNLDCIMGYDNGRFVSYENYVALQQKLDAMAAENASMMALAIACEKEFGSYTAEEFPDDAKVSFPEDKCHITFGMIRNALNKTTTDAYLNSVRAEVISEFCALIDKYGKVEPHHFDPDFADLYAKINKKLYEGILDNPAVYDMESLVDWIERGADDSRAYADMAIIFWNEQLRSGTHDTADKAG